MSNTFSLLSKGYGTWDGIAKFDRNDFLDRTSVGIIITTNFFCFAALPVFGDIILITSNRMVSQSKYSSSNGEASVSI